MMLDRLSPRALFFVALALPLAGCTNQLVDTLSISPTTQTLAVGQTVQFTATGSVGHGSNHPPTTSDVTNQVTWTSSVPSVATINASGLATAVSAGATTITATINGYTGLLTATAQLSVGGGSGIGKGTTPTGDVTSITVIPSTQSVAAPGGTATFIPIGTTAGGGTVNLTGTAQLVWASSSNQIGTVNAAGFATGISQGTTTITAAYTNPDSTTATGTATFQVLANTAELVTALTIFPSTQSATSLGQQSQFTALGTENGAQYDLTSQVVWTSSTPSVATVGTTGNGTSGLVTALAAGSTTIEAAFTNKDGSQVIATATYSVTAGTSPEPLLSINVVPAGITVSNQGMTGQYLAFGTFSTSPLVRDITNEVTWISLLPEVASIGSGGTPGEIAGLATAEGYTGFTPIYAEDTKTNPDGTVVLSNSQSFTCKDQSGVCEPQVAVPQFSTVSVYVEGENTSPTGEYVTAPSDTGTPDLIHCGPDWTGAGGQVCTGTYEVGTNLTLTENLPSGSAFFGGWSSGAAETLTCTIQTGNTTSNDCGFADPTNPPAGWFCYTVTTGTGTSATTTSQCYDPISCTPAAGFTNANSPTCTLPLLGNATVGVIFY